MFDLTVVSNRIKRGDMLLLLLYAKDEHNKMSPIKGKTRLQKELFLAQKKLREMGIITYYSFLPYKLGPYSVELYDDVEWMSHEGVLSVKKINLGEKGIYAEFSITRKGMADIEDKMKEEIIRHAYGAIEEIKQNYNNMNITELVEYTHQVFPDYVQKFEN